jgi:hypothetical protein
MKVAARHVTLPEDTTMSNKASWVAAGLAFCVLSTPAFGRGIRIDDGFSSGNSGVWIPQSDTATFGEFLDIGWELDFFGTVANSVLVNADGSLSFFNNANTNLLGAITPLQNGTPFEFSTYGRAVEPGSDPLPPLNGDAIENAFRILWQNEDGFEAQLALFGLASGTTLIEFNYWDDVDFDVGFSSGIDVSGATVGLINTVGGGTQFDLLNYLTTNQQNCVSTLGADDGDPETPASGTGCTAYFVDGVFASNTLPDPFVRANGGTADNDDPIADYRYLLSYAGTVTPPPTQVPEPGMLSLLGIGLAMLAIGRRRGRTARFNA